MEDRPWLRGRVGHINHTLRKSNHPGQGICPYVPRTYGTRDTKRTRREVGTNQLRLRPIRGRNRQKKGLKKSLGGRFARVPPREFSPPRPFFYRNPPR